MNPEQRTAVEYLDGPLLVLAGAGSGKTGVITHKIAYLIQDCGYLPSQVLAVTFTNKAAKEMSHRAAALLKNQKNTGLNISTFHTFGLKFIKKEAATLGFKPNISIFDTEDSLSLLRELACHSGDELKEKLELYLQCISHFKNATLSPTEALKTAGDPLAIAAAKLYIEYQRQLKVYNAVDFDDLILIPLQALKNNPELLEKWQNKIRYLLVDEYQDTNKTQYQLVQLLAGPQGKLTVVGDDHQSIYAWRGAKADNLIQLQQDFPRLKVIKLEQNYRSTGTILHATNQLIANNPSLFAKNLWSQLGQGDPILILMTGDEEHEANRVVVHLLSHQFQHRGEYRNYAILYRSNHQSRIFEKTLREHKIPYQVSGGISFFARSEIKDLLAYLKLLVNPDDDCAFLRIANVPKREIGPSTLEKLGNYAKQRNLSLFAASFELGLEQTLTGKSLDQLQNFTNWITLTADNAERGDTMGVINDMVKKIHYESWLLDTTPNPKTAERKIQNVQEFLQWLKRLLDNEGGEPQTLLEVVQKILLMDLLERNQEEKTADCVQLMTLHAAKGLEFDHVFLVGLEEGILPHRNSIQDNNIEEERRLAYVGMTRAKKTLTLSLARQRKNYADKYDCVPSRFLEELPPEDVVWDGRTAETDPVKKQQKGQSHLATMRAMLQQDLTS